MFVHMRREWQQWSVLKKSVVSFAIFTVVYSVLGFLILPFVLKDQIQKRGRILLGRQVEVDDVFVNPYLFHARITGFRVQGKNEDKVVASFAELSGRVNWLPLIFKQTLKFSTVQLEKPLFQLIRYPNGLFNITDLIHAEESERSTQEIATATQSFLNLALADVSVTGGAIFIDDQLKSLSHEIIDINFGLPSISDHQDQVNELVTPHFSAVVNGTLFDFIGESKPFTDKRETGVEFTCKNMDLSILNPYLPDSLPFVLTKGEFDFSLRVNSLYLPEEKRFDLVLSGDVRLHDFIVDDKQGERFATLSSLDISIKSANFFTQAIQLNSVRLVQPELHLARQKDGTLKWASFFAGEEKDGVAESSSFLVESNHVSLVAGNIMLTDHVPSQITTHEIQELDFALQNFSTATDHFFDVDLRLVAGGSGILKLNGQAGLSPLKAKIQGELTRLPLLKGQNYIAEQAVVVLAGGTVSSTFSVSGEINDSLDFQVEADVQIDDLVILEGKDKPEVVGLKSFVLGVLAKNNPFLLQIKNISLDNPRLRVEVQKNGTLNMASLVKEKKKSVESASQGQADYLGQDGTVEFGLLTIENGQFFIKDHSVSPFYHVDITEFNGTVSDVSTLVAEGGAFTFNAVFDHHSPLVMTGHANPFPPNQLLDIDLGFTDIEMSPFSPYGQKIIGRDLTRGKLSLKQQVKIQARKLDVDMSILIDQLRLGEYKSNDTATGLPVGLAVALLQDRHGVIRLDIPIAGSLDDPEFGIGGAVVRVLVNLVTKAATAPFSLIGSMFSGDGDVQFVPFSTGEIALDTKQQEILVSFAKVLYDRPGLKVEIGSQYDPGAEQNVMRQFKFENILKEEKLKALMKAGVTSGDVAEIITGSEEYGKYLLAAYKNAEFKRPRNVIGILEKQTPVEMERMLKANIKVTPGELRLLAMQRSEAVATLLRENGPVESERLFVLEPVVLAAGAPQVELRLQ